MPEYLKLHQEPQIYQAYGMSFIIIKGMSVIALFDAFVILRFLKIPGWILIFIPHFLVHFQLFPLTFEFVIGLKLCS